MELKQRDFRYGETAFNSFSNDLTERTSTYVGYAPTNNQDVNKTLETQDDKRELLISLEEKQAGEEFNEYTPNSAPNLNDSNSLEPLNTDWWKWFMALICCIALLYWFNRKF